MLPESRRKSINHHPNQCHPNRTAIQTAKAHNDPSRLRRSEMLEHSHTGFGKELYRLRPNIERQFSCYSSAACGLRVAPPWVRRLHRVKRWIGAKLVLLVLYLQRLRKAR